MAPQNGWTGDEADQWKQVGPFVVRVVQTEDGRWVALVGTGEGEPAVFARGSLVEACRAGVGYAKRRTMRG